jgi:beta-lactamase class D
VRAAVALAAVFLLAGCAAWPAWAEDPAEFEPVDLSRFFEGIDGPGTFVLLESGTGRLRVHGAERASTRYLPASTFKIANTMIALETGVAEDLDLALPYDPEATPPQGWWPESWRRDQTMRSAFRDSVYWYYQEIARRIGPERMRSYLDLWGYGNREPGPEVDSFWLYGDLRISPLEQIDFLRRLHGGELGASERSTALVKELMLLDERDGYRLSGKTGTSEVTPTRERGWLVGWREKPEGDPAFYALHMEGERVWEEWPPQERKELVWEILEELGVVPGR